MRILFVFKSVEWLGIEYLSAALKRAGHKTDMAFEPDLGGTFYFKSRKKEHNEILKKVQSFKPDLVLFSCTTNLFPWVKEAAGEIKKYFKMPIIVGGIHPTIQPEKTIECDEIDMICIGEGDEAIVELVDRMEKRKDYYKTKNFWFKKGKKIIKNGVRDLIEDLDSLPFPDKDMFYKYGCFIKRAYVMASRGCPYQCTYCFNHQMQKIYKGKCKSYVRRRSVDSVIEELRLYRRKYGIKSVHFYDDTFILDKRWIFEFAKKYKREINLPFYCLVRANLVTDEIIMALKYAGCKCVSMGIESGNLGIRNDVLRRNMSNEQIISAARIIKQNKIKLVTFNIFGFPGETPKEMLDTMKINLRIKPDSLFTYIFYPFPNTDLMKESVEKGYLNEEAVKLLAEGEGNYQSSSLLNHPYKEVAYNMKVILPLLNKMPCAFYPYFLQKWVFQKHPELLLNMIKVASIPFYSSWESWERLKEQISMFRVAFFNRA